MIRTLVAAFLAAHGAIHIFMYLSRPSATNPAPFKPDHSWALEGVHVPAVGVHALSVAMGVATAAVPLYCCTDPSRSLPIVRSGSTWRAPGPRSASH